MIGCGCLLWALCTATFACLHSLEAGVAVWAVNGFGLALVLPNTQVGLDAAGRQLCGQGAARLVAIGQCAFLFAPHTSTYLSTPSPLHV